jgi:hypothetical protein
VNDLSQCLVPFDQDSIAVIEISQLSWLMGTARRQYEFKWEAVWAVIGDRRSPCCDAINGVIDDERGAARSF